MFQGNGSNTNPVRCVNVTCDDENHVCIFKSSTTNKELPIVTSDSVLHSDDNCTVNFVDIIHYCAPIHVDLELRFTTRAGDPKLYLQV